jgi:acetylornithine deacetylase
MTSRLTSLPMIEKMIGFDTVSRKSNLALIDWVRDYLDGYGIESRLIYDDERNKANLFASIGPIDEPGIILSGHSDVVPVDGQNWASDPFTLTERDGKLYGRGSADMKSFIGAALAIVPELSRRKLKTPIQFAFSYDEEVGCRGVPSLIADLEHLPIRPKACIVGEPTSMQVISGHKGKMSMRCHVHGLECHSALADRGVNAIEAAAETILFLRSMLRQRQQHGPFDHSFDPPYTTIHTGTIKGGTALNIVPKDCSFDFEFRNVPSEDTADLLAEVKRFVADQVEPEMKAKSPETGISFEPMSAFPGLRVDEASEATTLVKSLAEVNGTGRVSYGTEAGLFDKAGIPTVVCGPGSIEQAHKPDEWIEIDQIARCEAFLGRLIDRVTAH